MDSAVTETAIHLVETEVVQWIQYTVVLADEESTQAADRFNNQSDLPGFREKMVMQPGIIIGQEDTHMRVRVIPTYDLFAHVTLFDDLMVMDDAVLSESQVNTALPCVKGWQDFFDDQVPGSSPVVQAPLTHQDATDLIVQVTGCMDMDAGISLLR